ncbi:MAG: DUF4835 family protein [Chitinophagaceae bacterium]|jgi:hypothetical protein|nr:DUF4835 family protein [Chitinophagaceae bacterium]MCA6496657.1 DUF4835 family protein [Chitinophagaceae bacterium]
MKFKVFLLLLFFFPLLSRSQELQAKVTVITSRITTTVDKRIFITLQTQLNNLMNTRKWSNDVFQSNEKIDCSFILNLETIVDPNVYKATLTVQAARPVYNSSYQCALLNYLDADVTFKYQEFQPVEFNENRIQGNDPQVANLTAIFAYYAYMIIGLDYDSFSPKGGEAFFRKAQQIVNNAPEGKGTTGWRVFDGLRNRYWLNENLINNRYNIVHDIIYSYYRAAMDKWYDNEAEARRNMLQCLTQLQAFNKENPNTMIQQIFMQGKMQELVGLFKKGTADERNRAITLLQELDVINAQFYKQQLK